MVEKARDRPARRWRPSVRVMARTTRAKGSWSRCRGGLGGEVRGATGSARNATDARLPPASSRRSEKGGIIARAVDRRARQQ